MQKLMCMCVCVHVCLWVYFIYTSGMSGTSAAGLGTGCRCQGTTVHFLHRSRWLSPQAGKLWYAVKALWHSYWGELWVFLFIHNQAYGYQECRAFTRVLLMPWEVVKCTLLISIVQNGNLSFLDCQWLRALLEIERKDKSLFFTGVVVRRMLLPSLNSKCFRWGRLRSNHKREKYIIPVSFS